MFLFPLAGLLALEATSAQALVAHKYLFQFNEVPASSTAAVPGPLTKPNAMAVDAGHLWTAEQLEGTNSYRVNEFAAETGAFLSQPLHTAAAEYLGLAVSHPEGQAEPELLVTEYPSKTVSVYSEAGVKQATWTGAGTPSKFNTFALFTVAADNSTSLSDWAAGDVYVPVGEEKVVDVFKPEAGSNFAENYITHLTGTCATPTACTTEQFGEPRNITVNSTNGDVLVQDGKTVDIFEPTVLNDYAFVRRLTGTPSASFDEVGSLATDSESNVYVVDNRERSNEPPVVDEFSPAGVYLGRISETSAGPFPLGFVSSIAVDTTSGGPTSGDVYASDFYDEAGANVTFIDAFGPNLVLPDVTTGAATAIAPESATLNGTVNPAKAGAAKCWFAYGTTRSFGQEAPCAKEVPEGENTEPVQVSVTGLQPDTVYFYRLQASNANGTNTGESSQDQELKTPGPGIHSEFVENVAATSASFGATIDPDGAPTTYYFQYSTSSTAACGVSLCAAAPASPGISVGAGHGDVSVAPEYVSGLLAATRYHYRLVALSEQEGRTIAFFGPDQTFTTQTVGGGSPLLDGRSWEMVSPPEKHGALLIPIASEGVIQAAASGGALTYLASSPTEPEPEGYTNLTDMQVLATRGAGGWVSRDIPVAHESSTSQAIGTGNEYEFFSEDLLFGVVHPFGGFIPASSPQALAPTEASEQTPFLRTNYDGGQLEDPCLQSQQHSCYRPLVTGMPGFADVAPGTRFGVGLEGECPPGILCGPEFVGASPDGRHIVVESQVPLLGTEGSRLYEWSEGKLAQVVGIARLGTNEDARHTVSADGSRIIGMEAVGAEVGFHLYLRDMVKEENVQLDAVQGGSGDGRGEVTFQDASADGSKVYFTDAERLTPDSRAGGVNAPDLYECEIVEVAGKLTCKLTDLTVSLSGGAGGALGVVGVSRDGSWVYFVANGVLTQDAVPGKCSVGGPLPSDSCNVYVRHDGTTRLVAILSETDLKVLNEALNAMTMRVSPNGRWLAFMSSRELTGYDTHDAISGKPDEEVYLYHAPSELTTAPGALVCASCNPTGARPVGVEYGQLNSPTGLAGGDRVWDSEQGIAANVPGWTPYRLSGALYQSRYLSDSGRLFFNSSDALVPQDVNGNEDVYEYEPLGEGGCTAAGARFSERSGGCVGLVSSGGAAGESAFLDASETGGDVFFLTYGQLTAQDYDTALDVYDAHECTAGSPCLPAAAAVPPPCSTGDSCKPAPSAQPAIYGAPASATFNGAGNVSPSHAATHRALTRAQRLARALKACRRKVKRKRRTCERRARGRFAAKHVHGKTGRAARKAQG